MDKVKTYAEAQEVFNSYGFRFDAKSIRFLLDRKKSFAEISDVRYEENCVYMVAAALTKDETKAIDVIMELIDKGIGISLLHVMLKNLAREQDFTLSPTNLAIFEEMSRDSDLMTSQDIADVVTQEMSLVNQNLGELSRQKQRL